MQIIQQSSYRLAVVLYYSFSERFSPKRRFVFFGLSLLVVVVVVVVVLLVVLLLQLSALW